MRPFVFVLILLCASNAVHADADAQNDIAFVHVNVAPMDRDRVLHDQTVLVHGERIVAVGPDVSVPPSAMRIDGHGTAWLAPGLADMHTHSQTKNDLAIYLANGVTTVLNMGDAHAGFIDSTVPAVNRGALPGPRVFMGFLVDGTTDYNGFVVRTPDQARAIVDLAKANGYDFIKVYVGLAPDVFDALADAGRREGLPLVGHGVTSVRLDRQLAAGQVLVAHAEEFFYTFFTPRGVEESDSPPEESRIPEAIALARQYGATVTADLATYTAIAHQIGHADVIRAFLEKPESYFLAPQDRVAWQNSSYVAKTTKLEAKLQFLRKLVKAMADSGVSLVAGTDAPAVPGLAPGFSLHDDLDALQAAGLTPYQALSTATRAPGEFLARSKNADKSGVVAAGYRADLVLAAENPLRTLATLRTPVGVMVGGHWHDAASLDALKADVRDGYRRATSGY
jgi:imidazolonepropionase-like amidohydrolase